ncbi:MAG: phosphoenolpyruvate--protein phosphotransferase [Deltaproteobacteria bacterium]|nr:phosphoenolpyruvate--protein phosphotransferase [Deltaproteobacteria bacterium]
MIYRDQLAKTFSRIAQALKISKHDERPLAYIVQIIREHFHAEVCSLHECHQDTLTLAAIDKYNPSLEKRKPQDPQKLQELIALVLEKRGAVFAQDRAAVPLVYQEKIVGVLTLQRNQLNGFDLPERQFLEFIVLQLAGVIQSLTIAERAKKEMKKNQASLVFQGIAVSSGFGIGPALLLHEGITSTVFSKPDLSSQSTQSEQGKLKAALQKTLEDLSHLEKSVEKKFSKEESDIFYSQQIMLSDINFLKKLESSTDQGKSALEAVDEVLKEYMHQFSKSKNPRLEEIVIDFKELKQRILKNLLGIESHQEKENWTGVLVAHSLGPSDTIHLDASKLLGIVTMTGGLTSHAAILARSLGIPAVMGAAEIMQKIHPGDLLIVDGSKGEVIVNPDSSSLDAYELFEKKHVAELVDLNATASETAVTLDGHVIHLEGNVSFISDIKKLRYFGAEGIGLFRTEFLFLKGKNLPNENEQFDIYCQIIKEAEGLPVTFRILDTGGDKPIEALCIEKETNPFLGYRSIRLMLSHPEILKIQLRALLRSSAFGSIRLLIPMISGMEEVDATKKILEEVKKNLSDENISYDPQIPFGLMIEVPSAVAMVSLLVQEADFLSIGSNDLTQYSLAVDRNNERVASFFEPLHPAVISFISQVASAGLTAQKPVGICGEMASDPFVIPLLLGLGISSLSMIPSSILVAKKLIRNLNQQEAQEMAKQALQASRIEEVKSILRRFQN